MAAKNLDAFEILRGINRAKYNNGAIDAETFIAMGKTIDEQEHLHLMSRWNNLMGREFGPNGDYDMDETERFRSLYFAIRKPKCQDSQDLLKAVEEADNGGSS